MKSQIQVVQSAIAIFNETITYLYKAEETLNKNIKAIEEYTKNVEIRHYNSEVKENIRKHLSFLTLLCNEMNNELDTLVNSMIFAK